MPLLHYNLRQQFAPEGTVGSTRRLKDRLTNDIPLDGLIGVRVLREGPSPEIQEMSGYFQGPLGGINVVTCRCPADRQWEFRPIANAISYSFSF